MLALVIVQGVLFLSTIVAMAVTLGKAKETKSYYWGISQLLKTEKYGELKGIASSVEEMIEALESRFKVMKNWWEKHIPDKTRPLGSTEPTEEELISTEAMRYQPLVKVADTLKRAPEISKWLKKEYPDTYKQLVAALDRVANK